MTEDYRNRLVGDIHGIIRTYTEGDRPLYHKIAESIFDYIMSLFTHPEIFDRHRMVELITNDLETIFGFDLTGREHNFERSDVDKIREYYGNLIETFIKKLDEDTGHLFDLFNDYDSRSWIRNIVSDYIFNVLVKRGYLKKPYQEHTLTYVSPNNVHGQLIVTKRTTVKEVYDDIRRQLGRNDIRIFTRYSYLEPVYDEYNELYWIGFSFNCELDRI